MKIIGKILYFATLPAILIAVRHTTRTRVLIRCQDRYLVLKPWLGSDVWMLPGGGLHRNEDPLLGALREVKEETGLTFAPGELRYLGLHRAREKNFFHYDYQLYMVDVPKRPPLKLQKLEVRLAEWLTLEEIQQASAVNETTLKCILTFRNS